MREIVRVIVIGAGVAGLATAALLAREGHEVVCLERHDRVGGRAGVLKQDGFRFDTGPSWYLMPRVFEHFFELMGTTASDEFDLVTLDPGYRVFGEAEGEPIDIPHGEAAVREVFERLEPGAGEALGKYLVSARETLEMAQKYFLYNPFASPRTLLSPEILRRFPKLAVLLGRSLEKYVGSRFRHPLLRQILGYPAVFLGTHPSAAPSMYHLMSALDLDDGVHYPVGGFWGLIQKLEQLARDAGAQFITGAEVLSIETRPIGVRRKDAQKPGLGRRKSREVTGVRWRDQHGREHLESADVVVSAADLHHTETQLLTAPDRTYPQHWWDRRESGPGAVLTLIGVKGELDQLPHHSLFFTRDWRENFGAIFGADKRVPNPASVYVCRASATDSGAAPDGFEQLFILTPVPADARIGAGGADGRGDAQVEEVSRRAIRQIADWARIPDLEERIVMRQTIGPADFARDYSAWSAGMLGPSHTLAQSAMFRAQGESKKVAGLFYAGGASAPGIGVPMCLISAEIVLKRLRGDASAGPLPPAAPQPPAATRLPDAPEAPAAPRPSEGAQ